MKKSNQIPKRNVNAIIITAAVILAASAAIVFGVFGGSILGSLYQSQSGFSPSNISDSDIGGKRLINAADTLVNSDARDFYFLTLTDPEIPEEDYTAFWFGLDAGNIDELRVEKLRSSTELGSECYVSGIIRRYSPAEDAEKRLQLEAWVRQYYNENLSTIKKHLGENITADLLVETELNSFTPYYFEAADVLFPEDFCGTPFIVVGAAILFIAVVFEVCFVFRLRKRIVVSCAVGTATVLSAVVFALLFNHLRTALSITEAGIGLYTMQNYECTDTNGMIDANLSSIDDFLAETIKKHYFNLPMQTNRGSYGCAAFAAVSGETHYFGRNFDYSDTDAVLIYSHPEGAYASIGMADMTFVEVGRGQPNSVNSVVGKARMLMLPYVVVDGVNEAGLGTGILELVMDEIHQDEGKPDILIFTAIRAILDSCATVEEAIDYLGKFDVHSDLGRSYHIFVADKTGDYAVIEWLDGNMSVNRLSAVTNSVVTPGKHYNKGQPDGRLGYINWELSKNEDISAEKAMDMLKVIKQDDFTQWSCVYDLDNFTVNICTDVNYDTVYHFEGRNPHAVITAE